jgi:hypothetical protein
VNENAFAFIVQARPCPTFGRPVHLRGGPHRLQPGTSPHALQIPPRDGHLALRKAARIGSRSALAVSSFRLRARLGFSIPLPLSGPRGITPAFGYGAPHPSARGTSTPLSNALLSAHYEPLRHPLGRSRLFVPVSRWLFTTQEGFPGAKAKKFLDRSFPMRCLQPPRGFGQVLAHCFPIRVRLHPSQGTGQSLRLNEAESSLLSLRLMGSPKRGFSLSGFPSGCSPATC